MTVRMGEIALRYALQEMAAGAAEIGGNNRGPFVEKYLNARHPDRIEHREQPWCAAFWCWCWLEAQRETRRPVAISFSRSCAHLLAQFEERGQVRQPSHDSRPILPGDAVFWDFAGGGTVHHVNMVYEVRDGVLYTIGGNEGSEDSGAPVSVKRRGAVASLKQVYAFGLMSAGEPA